ncbi:MAG TPA: cell division/cell wall cluster transcriptional repressor MraZ, partial [Planctomycetaceae bacterium]|nr:cell division/cell wall cluster transcriptional repressor MraZ [Planctomycetaceae bacterium]
ALSPAGKESRAFSRLFYAQAQPAEVDRNGRLRIPVELAKWAGLVSEVVVVGVRDRIEVWDSVVWDRFLEQNQPVYDSLAEAVWNQAMG